MKLLKCLKNFCIENRLDSPHVLTLLIGMILTSFLMSSKICLNLQKFRKFVNLQNFLNLQKFRNYHPIYIHHIFYALWTWTVFFRITTSHPELKLRKGNWNLFITLVHCVSFLKQTTSRHIGNIVAINWISVKRFVKIFCRANSSWRREHAVKCCGAPIPA